MRNIKLKNLLIVLFAALILVSCNESSFLNLNNPNQSTDQDFWRDKKDAESALAAAYSPIRRPMNGYYGAFAGWLNLNGRADDIFSILNEEAAVWSVCTFQNTPSTGNNSYSYLYQGIQRANVLLRYLDDVPADKITDKEREVIRGEALFLRAYQYYLLTNEYKQVPLRLLPSAEDVLMKPRATEEELWAQIEADLKAAIACELPIKRSAEELGRVEKGAAVGLLGKVYLTQEKFQEARDILKTLLSAPYQYELVENFEDNFREDSEFNSESVFELNYGQLGTAGSWGDEGNATLGTYIPQFIGPVKTGGWFKIIPSAYVITQFIEEQRPDGASTKFDKRMYGSFFFNPADYGDVVANTKWYGNKFSMNDLWDSCAGKLNPGAPKFPSINGKPGRFMLKKYTNFFSDTQDDSMGENSGNNLRVMRFAEVLLMYAEACVKTDDFAQAQLALDKIRDRAGLAKKSFTSDELMPEIQKQSLLEFVGEGIRFNNLKRWYPKTEDLRSFLIMNDKQGATNFENKHYYYPVPTDELSTNSAMEQNDPWK